MNTTVGIANDHSLFLKSLSHLISGLEGFEIMIEAQGGEELLHRMRTSGRQPDIIILDVPNAPDIIQTVSKEYPAIKLVALSLNEEEKRITDMLRAGCCAYLPKQTSPEELAQALRSIRDNGSYRPHTEQAIYTAWMKMAAGGEDVLSEKEQEFLTLACSELTYQEIAGKMNLSERTIDGYREALFAKLRVQSRVGMCIEAIRRGWVKI
jgi:DNA-binding NarL/FixJ family response regulator